MVAPSRNPSEVSNLPSGTVTFLFTDVEGSTRLLYELGADAYAEALTGHRRVIREACSRHGGVEVDTQGDSFFLAFPTAPGALAAAEEITDGLVSGEVRVRIEKIMAEVQGLRSDPEDLRQCRAVEVLEQIRSPTARQLLDELARGSPGAILTEEARAALARLKQR